MKPWIILTAISLILDIFNILKAVLSLAIADIVISIIGWMVGAYFFLVVWSYKAELEEAQFPSQFAGVVHYNKADKEDQMNMTA
jgi:hypothetical protein